MTVKIAISGFGRIGRNVLRAIAEAKRKDLTVVAINDLVSAKDNAHLLQIQLGARPLPGRGQGRRRHPRRRHGPDQGAGRARSQEAAVEGSRHRHRDGVHGHLHRPRQGRRASGSRRQAGAGVGAVEGCGPDGRVRGQSRQAEGRPQGGVERLVHHQLPGAGGQGPERPGRHQVGLHDHHPRLHQRPERAGSGAQGSAPCPRRRAQHDPDLDGCGLGRRAGAARAEGQARRHGASACRRPTCRWWT